MVHIDNQDFYDVEKKATDVFDFITQNPNVSKNIRSFVVKSFKIESIYNILIIDYDTYRIIGWKYANTTPEIQNTLAKKYSDQSINIQILAGQLLLFAQNKELEKKSVEHLCKDFDTIEKSAN